MSPFLRSPNTSEGRHKPNFHCAISSHYNRGMLSHIQLGAPFPSPTVRFSIAAAAAWAPGVETPEAWLKWANDACSITPGSEPGLRAMPAMQRRRVRAPGRMALEVAYACLGDRVGVPTIFCSVNGEVSRSVELLQDLAVGEPQSPTSFSLSVHNAAAGLFSIARGDTANHLALSAREATVEHAAIEACGMLADGEEAVLLVASDCPLPAVYSDFQRDNEQPYAWAWLIEPPKHDVMSLAWSGSQEEEARQPERLPAGLQILRFQLREESVLNRQCGRLKWTWSRNV